jgi:dATP pyrophosphohydrolase
LIFREEADGLRFTLFKRADIGIWQGVCGGGESGESIEDAAFRECAEEAGITQPGPLYPLDSIGAMKCDIIPEWTEVWGKDVLVLPMYHFAMEYCGEIRYSEEHTDCAQFTFEEALAYTRFEDQSLAIWELNERLKRGNLKRPIPPHMKEILK